MGAAYRRLLIRKDNTGIPLAERTGILDIQTHISYFPRRILTSTYAGLLIGFNGGQFTDDRRSAASGNPSASWKSTTTPGVGGIYKLQLAADGKHVHSQLYTEGAGLLPRSATAMFKSKSGRAARLKAFTANLTRGMSGLCLPLSPILGNMEIRYMNEDAGRQYLVPVVARRSAL